VEKLTGQLNNSFDIITARAVAPAHELIGMGIPFLRRNGIILTVKGVDYKTELNHKDYFMVRISEKTIDGSWIEESSYLADKLFIKMEKKNGGAKTI
jgi:16S rRNA G527 N7-methylase RsmG